MTPDDAALTWSSRYDVPVLWLVACVVGTLGNTDVVSTFLLRPGCRHACLANLVAANVLAMLCLPLNYLLHFHRVGHSEGSLVFCVAAAREMAVGLQTYSAAVLSVARFLRSRSLYESLPVTDEPVYYIPVTSAAGPGTRGAATDRSTVYQTLCIWIAAVLCAVPASKAWRILGTDNHEPVEDAVLVAVIFHFLLSWITPVVITFVFYVLTECRRVSGTGSTRDRLEGRLIPCLGGAILANYLPFYVSIIYARVNRFRPLSLYLDFAAYFPLYSTACWIPVLMFFVGYRLPENSKARKCSSEKEADTKVAGAKDSECHLPVVVQQARTDQSVFSVAVASK